MHVSRVQGTHYRIVVILAAALIGLMQVGSPAAQVATPQPGTPVAVQTRSDEAIANATSWLLDQQDESGGFQGLSGAPDAGTTIDAIFALSAADASGVDTADAIPAAVEFLGSGDDSLVYVQSGVGQAAKLVLGLHAAGVTPPTIASVDPVAILTFGQDEETGIYGTGPFDHALALLALSVAGEAIPESAIDALEETRTESGGWAFDGQTDADAADSNTTALVVQALVATGNDDSDMLDDALAFLETTVSADGAAFDAVESSPTDANSTAQVLQAQIAAGEDTGVLAAALLTFQNASGAFFFVADDPADNLFSTAQAIPALAGLALPVEPAG